MCQYSKTLPFNGTQSQNLPLKMTLRESYQFEPLMMKGIENKEKFYEAYDEIEPILSSGKINWNR